MIIYTVQILTIRWKAMRVWIPFTGVPGMTFTYLPKGMDKTLSLNIPAETRFASWELNKLISSPLDVLDLTERIYSSNLLTKKVS